MIMTEKSPASDFADGMREADSRQWSAILNRYTNPRLQGTPARRLNGFLHNETQSSELVRTWICIQAQKAHAKGQALTPVLLRRIAKRTSIETLMHEACHMPVRQIRAACLFERRLDAIRTETRGVNPPREQWAAIWDEEVSKATEDARRRLDAGEIREYAWLPYSNGASSQPGHADRRIADSGLDAWLNVRDDATPDRDRGYDVTVDWNHADPVSRDVFEPDVAWLDRHGITERLVESLTPAELEDMHVDPQAMRIALAGKRELDERREREEYERRLAVYETKRLAYVQAVLEAFEWGLESPVAPEPPRRPEPRRRKDSKGVFALYLILRDREQCRRLMDSGLTAREILTRAGIPDHWLTAGLRYEHGILLHPHADVRIAWAVACRAGRLEHVSVQDWLRRVRIARERLSDGLPTRSGAHRPAASSREDRLFLLLQNRPLARRLAGEKGGLDAILSRHGMPVAYARAGLRMARILGEQAGMSRPDAWNEAVRQMRHVAHPRPVRDGMEGLARLETLARRLS